MKPVRTLALGSAFAATFMAMPLGALAVNVTSSDGYGYQYGTSWYSNGADMTGRLTSTHGNSVYYQGSVAYSFSIDYKVGRYTSDTSSTTSVVRGGTVRKGEGGLQGVRVKVCKNNSFSPDSCGPYELEPH